MGRHRHAALALDLADLEPGAVHEEGGWFVANFRGDRIGKFYTKKQAEHMWRRWATSYTSGVVTPALSFTAVPRASRRGP